MAKRPPRQPIRPVRDSATVAAELDALYAELPTIDCRGACWDSCGAIFMTRPEQRRIAANGFDIPVVRHKDETALCPALTMLHQCGVHAIRPLICRLWGITEEMPCTFGCTPIGRGLLTDQETHEFLARGHDIAGEHEQAQRIREVWKDPVSANRFMKQLRRERMDEALARQARRQRIEASDAPRIYVRGRGVISKEPPSAGANSSRAG